MTLRTKTAPLVLPATTGDSPVWLRVGTLLDGTSTAPRRDAHVVYNRTAIQFVGTDGRTPPREILRPGQDCPDVDASDWTLLPGLAEAHAHLFLEGGELDLEKRAADLRQSPAGLLAHARERLAKLVHLGVVAVRDAGDKDGVGLALSKLYQQQRGWSSISTSTTGAGMETGAHLNPTVMPYVDSPGAAIHHRGRYGSFMADPLENYVSPRACVEARVKAGADRIKLIPTGIINFKQGAVATEPPMTTGEIAEIVVAAKSFGRQTFAHASGDTGIERVIEGGVDSVEHGFFVRDDQLARMRDRETAWVPTFAPVQAQVDHAGVMGRDAGTVANLHGILERHATSLVKAHALGVLIIAGSDAGSVGVAHGLGLLYELELMERAGMPALAVINSATGVGADRLGYRGKFGQIKAGWLSRFILTNHSPLETVANLRRPRTVVFDGEVFVVGEDTLAVGL